METNKEIAQAIKCAFAAGYRINEDPMGSKSLLDAAWDSSFAKAQHDRLLAMQDDKPAKAEIMVCHPLELYADSYEVMSRQGCVAIHPFAIATDIRNNMIPITEALRQDTKPMIDAEPDMLWDADDVEGAYGNGAEEFARDYASGSMAPGDISELTVQCAKRLPDRKMRIEHTRDEDNWLKWEWMEDAIIAAAKGGT